MTEYQEPSIDFAIRCYGFRGDEKTLESSNYAIFNPVLKPGCTVLAGSCAARASIGSQVACKLALDHFSTSLLDYYAGATYEEERSGNNITALENAFRDANRSVYSFGHSLAAGGRMAAVFLALMIRDGAFAAGRVGDGSAFLLRGGELYSFFDMAQDVKVGDEESYLGARSLVAVDLANVEVEPDDAVFIFSEELDASKENDLRAIAKDLDPERTVNPAEYISRFLFDAPSALGFAFCLFVGKKSLLLSSDMIREAS